MVRPPQRPTRPKRRGPLKRPRSEAAQGVQPPRGGVKFTATPAQRLAVAGLVSVGTEQVIISEVLRISGTTLKRHFKHELAHGRAIVHARVGGNITALALQGDKTMSIFYAKCQMGWQEKVRIGWQDAGGVPTNDSGLFSVRITG